MTKANKILIVLESPGKIKKVSHYLGTDYVVRASFGHICDLSRINSNLGVDVANDFSIKYMVMPDKKEKLKTIVDAASMSKDIIIATDGDREGEIIAQNLYDELYSLGIPIKRAVFNEITKKGILEGLKNIRDIDQNLVSAQQARRVLDRLVGFMVSPYLINTFGPNMSAGRVQSVAVRLVVDREREIEAFVPEEYWPVSATLAKPSKHEDLFVAKLVDKINNKNDADKVKLELESDQYKVLEVVAEEKVKVAPAPLITSTLQQVAARKFGLPAAKTMKCAQTLYEAGAITYIRTDSIRCSPESIEMVREWIGKNGFDLPEKANQHKSKDSAQNAHEAIRPTDVNKKSTNLLISDDEKKVYNLVWEYFIASQMKPARYDTVSVLIQGNVSKHKLKANGRTLTYKGWLGLHPSLDDEKKDEITLPSLAVNDLLTLVPPRIQVEQKFTQPPSRYKEHSLIKELEKRGIGRPATYAVTMQKLTERAYVEKRKDTFYATDMGKKIVDSLTKFFHFMEYRYTAEMEEKLDLIEQGKLSYLEMMKSFFPDFVDQLQKAQQSNEKDWGIVCDICKKNMRLQFGKFGFYLKCSDDLCKNRKKCELIDNKPVVISSFDHLVVKGTECPKCHSPMRIRDGKFGKFYSCVQYPKCTGSGKIPFGKKCSKCNVGELYVTIFNGESKLACMRYPDCHNIEQMPNDTKLNWIDPKVLPVIKKNDPVQKIINSSRKGL